MVKKGKTPRFPGLHVTLGSALSDRDGLIIPKTCPSDAAKSGPRSPIYKVFNSAATQVCPRDVSFLFFKSHKKTLVICYKDTRSSSLDRHKQEHITDAPDINKLLFEFFFLRSHDDITLKTTKLKTEI